MNKPIAYGAIALLVAVAALAASRVFYPLRALEGMVEDVRVAFLAPAEPQNQDIVLIAIDEDTLSGFPYRSPIDRGFLAGLVETLNEAGVRAIGLDVLFDQPTEPGKDAALRAALLGSKVPLIVATVMDPQGFSAAQIGFHREFLKDVRTGFANLRTERLDGTVREFEPFSAVGDGLPSFPAAIAQSIGRVVAPAGRTIAWRAPPDASTGPFASYPANALNLIPREWLRGRVALIGTDLMGIDRHRTPRYLDEARGMMAGVEVHAHVLAQLLEQRNYPRAGMPLQVLVMVLMSGVGVLLALWARPLWLKGLAGLAAVLAVWAGAFLLFSVGGPLLPLVLPTVALGAAGGVSAGLNTYYSRRVAARMRAAYLDSQAKLKETNEAKQRIEMDLSMARDIQMNMVPSNFPAFPGRTDFDLYAVMDPAKAVGGDLYDFFLIDEDHLFFLIGDVSDKGVPAALFMAMAKTLFKSAVSKSGADLDSVMFTVNNFLAQNNSSQQFVTIFACILDTRSGEIQYSDGGHDPPFILHRDGTVEMLVKKSGMAMGCFEGVPYQTVTFSLQPGDAFLLYTDGVNEAMNIRREMFEFERIREVVAPLCDGAAPQEICSQLLQAVKAFAGEAPQSDDITILAVRYLGPGGAA